MSLPFIFRVPYALYQLVLFSTQEQARSIAPLFPANWITQCLFVLPSLLRMFQCARRYRDSKTSWPHLANLGKYALTAVSYLAAGAYLIVWPTSTFVLVLLVLITSLSTLVSLYWDWVMDWGLLRPHSRHRGLRDARVYPHPWLYYAAMALNLLLRLTWILFLFPSLRSIWIYYAAAVSEVLRRAQWNFFRVEHEHLNNCDEFRAWRSLSMPFEGDLFFQPSAALPDSLPSSSTMDTLAVASELTQSDGDGGSGGGRGGDGGGALETSVSGSEGELSPLPSPSSHIHIEDDDDDDDDENEFYIKIQKQSGTELNIDLEVGSYSSADGAPFKEYK